MGIKFWKKNNKKANEILVLNYSSTNYLYRSKVINWNSTVYKKKILQ